MKLNIILAEIRERELISKNLSKHIAFLDYFDKSLNSLCILSRSISIASFATIIGVPAGIIGASCSFTFSITSGFVKKFLKTIGNKKKNHNKIVMLARSKLNSMENKISKALIDNEINHEVFKIIINEEMKYRELKESIRMINILRSDAEKVNLIEEGKKIVLMKLLSIMKLLITICNVNMYKYNYQMKSYCLKCRKDTENMNPKISKTSNGRTILLSKCAIYGSKK